MLGVSREVSTAQEMIANRVQLAGIAQELPNASGDLVGLNVDNLACRLDWLQTSQVVGIERFANQAV
ncbi:hypothetical protein V7x_40680 [Crateriforma conspicua]|uniref:Uncharacterized protein n=1 Tax=Crateriforma conspicua TaxID=2527996 RepID=A0A5C6FLL4_9PLAN|nr:hypothetical protein V7x_40680 [Crateriforma conspicua]